MNCNESTRSYLNRLYHKTKRINCVPSSISCSEPNRETHLSVHIDFVDMVVDIVRSHEGRSVVVDVHIPPLGEMRRPAWPVDSFEAENGVVEGATVETHANHGVWIV